MFWGKRWLLGDSRFSPRGENSQYGCPSVWLFRTMGNSGKEKPFLPGFSRRSQHGSSDRETNILCFFPPSAPVVTVAERIGGAVL